MKNLIACAVLLFPAAAGAESLEALRAGAAEGFAQSPALIRARFEAAAAAPEPVLQPALRPRPFQAARTLGSVAARVNLAAQLDRNLHVASYRFGARPRDLGLATDAGFKRFFFTFAESGGTALAPIGSVNDLRGNGVNARVDAATVYNFKVNINIFSPVRGSTLAMSPVAGTAGPAQSVKTGALLDAVRARAALMTLGGEEYWIFYGRDALPGGGGFAPTRSFLFVHMNGLSSKAWPLAEGALTPDAPSVVDLGGVRIAVTRTAAGELVVNSAN